MDEVITPSPPPEGSASPPPKCAICLGTFTNVCYSNSCMHRFCFTCLLEWSKIKPECPLCKLPFKSIIHNIKSNEDYEEHFVISHQIPVDELLYLPPTAPSRHFQFRTTFTVDPDGELAIQQMLLSHPLTNNRYDLRRNMRPGHTNIVRSVTSFRRSIYNLHLWVCPNPDPLSGYYRDISPRYYRENPAARNRLVPWLNRELNALLNENTQQIMQLVDIILAHLQYWHIRSSSFHRLLTEYLNTKTDHFTHEFYHFMRSPYDMIGYDRACVYSDRPTATTYYISDPDDDSDVAIVNPPGPTTVNNNSLEQPLIEVIEIQSDSSHDSDVIIGEPESPEVVLIESDSDNGSGKTTETDTVSDEAIDSDFDTDTDTTNTDSDSDCIRMLPLKLRMKRKCQSYEKKYKKRRYVVRTSSTSNHSFSSFRNNDESSDDYFKRKKRKYKYKKSKRSYRSHRRPYKEKSKSHSKTNYGSDTDSDKDYLYKSRRRFYKYSSGNNLPSSEIKSREKKKLRKHRQHSLTNGNSTGNHEQTPQTIVISDEQSKPSCSYWRPSDTSNSVNYTNTSSSFVPVTRSMSTNTCSTNNTYGEYSYNLPNLGPLYRYDHRAHFNCRGNSLPQFEDIQHFEMLPAISQYSTINVPINHYTQPVINNVAHDVENRNVFRNLEGYTPPRTLNSSVNSTSYRSDHHNKNSRRNYSYYNSEDNTRLHQYISPPRLNETVQVDYNIYSGSNKHQTAVKKEEMRNGDMFLKRLKDVSSDSDV